MTSTMKRNLITASIAGVCVVVLLAVNGYGRARRSGENDCLIGDRLLTAVVVDRPEHAYILWAERGFRGRIIVSLSRRLNFVASEEAYGSSRDVLTLQTLRKSGTAIEQSLRSENFLFHAMERGIARSIIHVLPDRDYEDKLHYARNEPGVSVKNSVIYAPHLGSPRILTRLPVKVVPDEPVLLYLNASFLKEHEPKALLRRLISSGIRTDFFVLCRSLDDPEVTDGERGRLAELERMLGGSDENL